MRIREHHIRRVLVVDDDEHIRTIALLSLVQVGEWETILASSGEEALRLARQRMPDVILLDVMLPGLSGPETLAQLKAAPETRSIPVIFSTARTQANELASYARAGASGVIVKPFDPTELPRKIVEIVIGQGLATARKSGAFDRVAGRFLDSLPRRVNCIHALMNRARNEPDSRLELVDELHRLHGTAGSYGFGTLSILAGELEHALRSSDRDWSHVAEAWSRLEAAASSTGS